MIRGLQKLLTDSEPIKWGVQNCLGLTVCLVFALVPAVSFTGSCATALFYAVAASCFSIDRSFGGRIFGGLLWISVFISGGLLGFGLASLAWLARGTGVPYQGLSDTSVDPESIPEVSPWFYIIMILGHLILSTVLTWARATAAGLDLARAMICQIFLSMMVVYGAGFLPVLGQHRFWTDNFGSLLKSGLVVLLAMFVNASFVYVRSSHDEVRLSLSGGLFSLGELLSKLSSDLWRIAGNTHRDGRNQKRSRMAPTSISVTRMTIGTQMSLLLSSMEPAMPPLCSHSDDARAFAFLTSKLQVHVGSVRSVEKITKALFEGIEVPEPVQTKLLTCAALITSTLAGVASEMSQALRIDSSKWEPHSLKYWDAVMSKIGDCLEEVMVDLHMSAVNGIKRALEEELDSPTDIRGTGIALLASLESVVDELMGLEVALAKALEMKETDLSVLIPETVVAKRPWYRYRWMAALVNDFLLASGIHIWKMQHAAAMDMLRRAKARLYGKSDHSAEVVDKVAASQFRRKLQLFWKVYITYQASVVAVVLITWLRFGRTGNYKDSAIGSANWVSNWYPEYFFLAVAICSQDTVDSSIYKAILRVSLIALGGGIALAAAAGEFTSPWWTYWITILVNFLSALPSVISSDFRYSLFLFSYTFNGIFVCSYRQPFSSALQVYAGKSVSTALGALFAAIVSNMIFPSYVSQVAFEFEAQLLSSYAGALTKCFAKGRAWAKEPDRGELWDPRFPRLGYKSPDHAELNRDLLAATSARLGIIRNLYSEVETKSLDHHFMFFLDVTLLPLPPALKLVFADISLLGMFATMSVRVLRSSFLRGNSGRYASELSTTLFDQTEVLLGATQDVSDAVGTILISKTIKDGDMDDLRTSIEKLQSERSTLSAMFDAVQLGGNLSKADVRTAAWYIMVLRGCKEVATLGKRLCERSDYQSKDVHWTLRVRKPRSEQWWR